MFDITIIGAGPAGSTLARYTGSRHNVLLIDKRPLDDIAALSPAGKCCGGLLAPDAQAMLSEMGLGLPRNVLVDPQIFVVRTLDLPQGLEGYYQRHYINMDREAFDRWLVSLVPDGVEREFSARVTGFTKTGDGFELTLKSGEKEKKIRSRVVVGADGGSSLVRGVQSTSRPAPAHYYAIQERVESPTALPYFTAVFDREITDYYAWVIPKEDCLLVGAALKSRDRTAKRFDILKKKLADRGFDLGRTVKREGAVIQRPTFFRRLVTGNEGAVLAGEAAGFISPSSAEGISYAFKSALGLADALEDGLEGFENRYRRAMLALRANILLKNLKSPFMYNPVLRKMIMMSGIGSMEIRK